MPKLQRGMRNTRIRWQRTPSKHKSAFRADSLSALSKTRGVESESEWIGLEDVTGMILAVRSRAAAHWAITTKKIGGQDDGRVNTVGTRRMEQGAPAAAQAA